MTDPVLTMVMLVVAAVGLSSTAPIFWSLPTAMLSGTAAAGGIAMINAVGNLGGFLGPYMFGLVKDSTGSVIATADVKISSVEEGAIRVSTTESRFAARLNRLLQQNQPKADIPDLAYTGRMRSV